MATQTKTINAGPVGLKPRGAYSATDNYTLLDCVLYNHDSWVCTAINQDGTAGTVTGQTPQDGSQYWKALTDGGRAAATVGTQVQQAWTEWFGATANDGIRKTVSDWFAQVQQAWTSWFSDTLATGVRKVWTDWFGARQTEWGTLSNDASTATSRANTAAAHAEDLNAHPAYIADGTNGDENYWYIYDHATQQYVKDAYAKGDNIDYDTMTIEEKDELAQLVLETLTIADASTATAMWADYDVEEKIYGEEPKV